MSFKLGKALIYIIISIYAFLCLLPFLMVVSGSLSNELDIAEYGYRLIPIKIDLVAYRILFLDAARIVNAYKISIIVTLLGTAAGLLVNSLMAYALSRRTLKYRKQLNIFTLVTILFNGGMVPWYIVCVNYLHLKDSLGALIVPYLANAWFIFLLRNFIRSTPEEIHESAKIDGAGEYTIFFKIIIGLMTPALATIGLFIALLYWNDWWLGLMLIDKPELQPLQLLLRNVVSNIQFLKSSPNAAAMSQVSRSLPNEGIKMAICIITIGPIVFVYPLVQKYFVKGIMIGSIKG